MQQFHLFGGLRQGQGGPKQAEAEQQALHGREIRKTVGFNGKPRRVAAIEWEVSAEKKDTPEAFFHAFGVPLKVFFHRTETSKGQNKPLRGDGLH
jgi:hypothetical protein